MTCTYCHEAVRRCRCGAAEAARQASLPGTEPWRRELRERMEDFRRRRARHESAEDPGSGATREREAARLIPFRQPPPPRVQATPEPAPAITATVTVARPAPEAAPLVFGRPRSSGGAEPIADPVVRRRPASPLATPLVETATVREPTAAPAPDVELRLDALIPPREAELAAPVRRPPRERIAPAAPILRSREFIQIALPTPPPATPEAWEPAIPVASRALRLRAGLIDAGLVGAASLLFAVSAAIAGAPGPGELPFKAMLAPLVGVPMSLAALYTLASFYLGSATPGMTLTGLEVHTPAGPAGAELLRKRAWMSLLSLGALGLGYGWVFCDSQGLAWHDAIVGTFIAEATDGRI